MAVMVSTIPPMRWLLEPSSRMAWPASAEASRTAAMASVARATVSAPTPAAARASSAAREVSCASWAEAVVAPATCSVVARAEVTERTWRSAPEATSPSARAISSTARPASADDEATSSEAPATLVAERDIWLTAARSSATRPAKAAPRRSRSERGCEVDGEVAGGDAIGGAGERAEVLDHRGQRAGGAPDLVAALDGELVVDVALGERLGGDARGRAGGG